MEPNPKYRLKPANELSGLLSGCSRPFVIVCNRCFQEFTAAAAAPDLSTFLQLAEAQGVTVTGVESVDFLCNRLQTEKTLQGRIPADADGVFVLSCGLGVQTLTGLLPTPVYAAADSLGDRGHHGMALTAKVCDACAQCYLNLTGGICPVADCAKGLLNGQCGGARDGRCEVDSSRECAWENIMQRLRAQGRLEEFLARPVQVRDYARVDSRKIRTYVRAIRDSRCDGVPGGIHPAEQKARSAPAKLRRFPDPEIAVIPLSQHAGKPAIPTVAVGDNVLVGQCIGTADGLISSPVHASISGTVIAVEDRLHPVSGLPVPAIVIRADGKNTPDPAIRPHGSPETLSPEEIVSIVRDCGIVGMGGAAFPTAVKLSPGKPIDTVVLNGCECEPMLTADHAVLLHSADDVLCGLRAVMKAVGAVRGILAIEDNKPDAIALLREKTAGAGNIEVCAVPARYPQGAEKILLLRVLGRRIPRGGLPADIGAVVCNVSTAKAISDAIQQGMPLIERVVTVTGDRVARPGDYLVKLGTDVGDILDACGVTGSDVSVKLGGPMMGLTQRERSVPVLKSTNGIIASAPDPTQAQACIRCGRCADVCPMELRPLYFARYPEEETVETLKERGIMDCIECRSCEWICPSKLPLLRSIKAGKSAVRGLK